MLHLSMSHADQLLKTFISDVASPRVGVQTQSISVAEPLKELYVQLDSTPSIG